MITEAEMLEQLRKGIEFPPLVIRLSRTLPRGRDLGIDAILEVRSEDQSFEFAAQLRTRSTPRAFEDALRSVRQVVEQSDYNPMLVTPYLREPQLDELQQQRMSGIDLSGNGVVCLPGEFFVYRTGKPNEFPDSAPTKYAYRGATSLVARAFLCQTTFDSLADIEQQVESRGGSIALSTISKALKRLESDLIIDRSGDSIRLRQPEKLLDKLADSYREPKVTRTFTGSAKQPVDKLISLARKKSDSDIVLSGRSSIDAYAVMGRDEWPVLYTSSIDRLIDVWGNKVDETSRFIDLELRQTDDPTVYFDVRIKQNLPYASPVQVFLECSSGDKREREVAQQVKDFILRDLKK